MEAAISAGTVQRLTARSYGVASAERSARRVDQRLAIGGPDVPRDRIGPRFARSLANLAKAIVFVPTVQLYDRLAAPAQALIHP